MSNPWLTLSNKNCKIKRKEYRITEKGEHKFATVVSSIMSLKFTFILTFQACTYDKT